MKKVCIALDASPSSEKVATIGYEFAKALDAEVILLHVVYNASTYDNDYDPFMGYDGYLIQPETNNKIDIKGEAEKFLQKIANFLKQPDLETIILEGEVHTELLKYAKNSNADLLVLGTHSHSALENIVMGNVATKIVKHSKTPLLIIPVS